MIIVQADNEFECISVLHGHSQDVKVVLWHPTQEVLRHPSPNFHSVY